MVRFGVTSTEMLNMYNYLRESLQMTHAGAIGAMCNLDAESDGFAPKRVEFLCRQRLRENGICQWDNEVFDQNYTDAVDSGKFSKADFLNPLPGKQYGYGLAQWTSPKRKDGLYTLAKKKGKSIGSIEVQQEFLGNELKSTYTSVLMEMQKVKDGLSACAYFLRHFEVPADCSDSIAKARYSRHIAIEEYINKVPTEHPVSVTKDAPTAEQFIDTLRSWIGLSRSKQTHRPIIDMYNSYTPHPRGYKLSYTDDYCDGTISAAAVKIGAVSLLGGIECGVEEHVKLFQKKGIWKEDGSIIPTKGAIIVYNWDDNTQPNYGYSDHIGAVDNTIVRDGRTYINTIEGNMSDGVVGTREIPVGWGYIRGYAFPAWGKADTAAANQKLIVAPVPVRIDNSGPSETPKYPLVVTTDQLNVRRWAGTEYPNIKSYPILAYNNKVDYCDTVKSNTGYDWYFVRIRKQDGSYVRGFIHSDFVQRVE